MLNTSKSLAAPAGPSGTLARQRRFFVARYFAPTKGVLAIGLMAAAVAVPLTGCASSHSDSTDSSAANMALFAPPVSAVQQMEIQTALAEIIRTCMAKHGFEYPSAPLSLRDYISGPANSDPLYTDTSEFRTEGYGIYKVVSAGAPKGNVSSDPDVIYVRSLPRARAAKDYAVLFGTKTVTVTQPDGTTEQDGAAGGCYGAAETFLYGSATQYAALSDYTGNLLSDVGTRATWASDWRSALKGWQTCMARHGFHYVDRNAAEVDISARYAAPGASISLVRRYELKVASQDAECVAKLGMNYIAEKDMAAAAGSMTSLETGALLAWNEMERHAALAASKDLANG